MTARVSERLSRSRSVTRANLAAVPDGRRVRYHVARAVRHLAATRTLVRCRRDSGVAYVSVPGGLSLAYVLPVVAVARLLRYQIVLHHHSFRYLDRRDRLFALMLRAAGGRAHHLFLCGRMSERFATTYGKAASSFHVVSNAWAIADRQASRDARTVGPVVLGHLSNLTAEKGLDTVLKTFDVLAGEDAQVALHLAGPFADSGAKDLVEQAVRRHPGRIVHFGAVSADRKHVFFAGVDVFVFPTRYSHEAEPLVVDEALAAGCAVVVTERGCLCAQNYESPATRVVGRDPTILQVADAVRELAKGRHGRDSSALESERRRSAADAQMTEFEAWLVNCAQG